MLSRLSIRDIVLIERLDIDYAGGLSVLTGETGAGKSILLDAFALALGSRGDASLVRQGAEQGQVTAAFDVRRQASRASPCSPRTASTAEDGLILRRVQLADGRTRAFVNDQPVSVQVLKALGSALVEIHGQHDDRAMVDVASHRQLLDAYAGLEDDAAAVARLWAARRDAEQAVAAHRARVEQAQREADYLRHAVEELKRLKPEAGEESALAEKRAAMMAVDKVAEDLRDAHDAVAGERSPISSLSAALRRLERRRAQAPALIDPPVKALDAALTALDEARTHLDAALTRRKPRSERTRPHRGAAVRAARGGAQIQRAGRQSRGAERAACGRSRGARCRRGGPEEAGGRGARRARRSTRKAAAALSAARKKAAAKLDKAVTAELKPLKLERARFSTEYRDGRGRAGRHRPHRVLGADQSGHAAGPADEGRVRRRACALPAGAEGRAGGSRLGADAGVRRDRHRRRRRGRGRDRRSGSRGSPTRCRWSR